MFPVFVYPAMLVYGTLVLIPAAYTFYLSFFRWPGAGPMTAVGLQNYRAMFLDPAFLLSLRNTLILAVVVGGGVFVVAFLLMMAAQQMKGRKFVRAVLFFPNLIPGVAIALFWGILFQRDGLVNHLLGLAGVGPVPWLADRNLLVVIALGMGWIAVGLFTVIFMSAADQIPPDLYEAARLEGASPLQSLRMITIPLLRDTVAVCAVLWSITAIKSFDFIIAFTASGGGLPPREVWNFALFSYAAAFGDGTRNYGIASAAGILMLILTIMLVWLSRKIAGKDAITY